MSKEIHKRVWLQPRRCDVHSYISYTIFATNYLDIRIASCDRNADFSFAATGTKDLKKLDKMIKILQEARDEYAKRVE